MVLLYIPSKINDFEVPTNVYNLVEPLHSRIFSFETSVFNLHVNRFLQDSILPFKCEQSEFIGEGHKHIFLLEI